MNIEAALMEKIKAFEDCKNQLASLSKQIGSLTEQQRAIYNRGLELKGSIDTLIALQQKEKEDLASSETAKLTLPAGVKPVINEAPAPVIENVPQVSPSVDKEPVTLEVK